METNSLAPHLRHATSSAWFNPITLVTHLPSTVSESEKLEDKLAIVHENIHFIQATSTFFGIYRFLKVWESITEVAAYVTQSQEEIPQELRSYFKINFENKLRQIPEAHLPPKIIDSEFPEGPCFVRSNDEETPAFCKTDSSGKRKMHFYDAFALQENMALAVERCYGFSEQSYNLAKDHPEVGFHYVIGTEAIKEITKWDYQSCQILSVILSDIALNNVSQNHVFFHGVLKCFERWPKFPGMGKITEVYRYLNDEFEFEALNEHRAFLKRELSHRKESLLGGVDPFDKALLPLYETMLTAIEKRQNEPEYFVKHLFLGMDDEDFITTFTMPSYTSRNSVMKISQNDDYSNAPLFISVAFHFFQQQIENTSEPKCPLYDLKICGFERDANCSQSPWHRKSKENDVCIYQFVQEAFFCAS